MYLFDWIITAFILIHVSEASDIYSVEGIGLNWTRDISKEFNISRPDRISYDTPIYDVFVSKDKHSIAVLLCVDILETHPKQCEMLIRTHGFNNQVHTKICKVHLPPEEDSHEVLKNSVTFLKEDRVLMSWKEHHKVSGWRMVSRVVLADSCQESDFIPIHTVMEGRFKFAVHMIVRFKNYFSIIFLVTKRKLREGHYRERSYDYDGLPHHRDIASVFTTFNSSTKNYLYISNAFSMNYKNGNEGPVLTGSIFRPDQNDIYSPVMGWNKAPGLFSHEVYSNSSGHATLCWAPLFPDRQLNCKWLDGSHGNNTVIYEFVNFYSDILGIYNAPNGNIMFLTAAYSYWGEGKIFIDEADVDGKCKRIAELTRHEGWVINLKLSMPQNDTACFSYLTSDKSKRIAHYNFITKCIKLNPNVYKNVTCGQY